MPVPRDVRSTSLPIGTALGPLDEALDSTTHVLLQAPPGAGKTTIVPLALLDAPWLDGRRIVMLEPRRLAARSAARWMASRLGERVGDTIGVRVRTESLVGPHTHIEVVTDGVLTRILQRDPALDDYGLVIFDEFHERSLQADAGLALTLQAQRLVRPELRILVMSATLDVAGLGAFLGDPPVVRAEGREFPVVTRYVPPARLPATPADAAAATRRALAENAGDILVFLPGVAEIRRCAALMSESALPRDVVIVQLHGMLAPDAQQRAILADPGGRRKVVLSTSIAETSLTIDGIRVVIDAGLSRRPRFSPRTGMARLTTTRVSRASADQRRGRAGRQAPGICYRLWDQADEGSMLPAAPAEILEADFVPLLLDLAAIGLGGPDELEWLDAPPRAAVGSARELLRELDALDADGRLTPHGRRLAEFGTHPRLAHMILRAAERHLGALACDVAALLEERDPLRGVSPPAGADLRERLDLLHEGDAAGRRTAWPSLDLDAVRRMRRQSQRWRSTIGADARTWERDAAGLVVALAYPDRIAQRRPGPVARFLLRNGTGASLPDGDALHDAAWLVVAASDGQAPESRIHLAAPISREDLEQEFAAQITTVETEADVLADGSIRAMRQTRLGAIALDSREIREPDRRAVGRAVARWVERRGIEALDWDPSARHLRQRLRFAQSVDQRWPVVSGDALGGAFIAWCLADGIPGAPRALRDIDLGAFLRSLVPPGLRASLDRVAPARFRLPSGRDVVIDYEDPGRPTIEARIQEMFGCAETPVAGASRIPLTVRLLSPANRPVQVTSDLAGFWRTSYHEVRSALRARYPKHDWPVDPLHAAPASAPRRRR